MDLSQYTGISENKDSILKSFNDACINIAAFMDEFLEEFPKGETLVVIPFINTQMPDIDEFWWDEVNIIAAQNYFNSIPKQLVRARAIKGARILKSNPDHALHFQKIAKVTKSKTDILCFLPHMLDYSFEILGIGGYQTLDTVCSELVNVNVSPWLVTNPDTANLNEAFMLAVEMQSTDAIPLRDKILKQANAGLFDAVRQHYDFI